MPVSMKDGIQIEEPLTVSEMAAEDGRQGACEGADQRATARGCEEGCRSTVGETTAVFLIVVAQQLREYIAADVLACVVLGAAAIRAIAEGVLALFFWTS